MKNVCFIGLSIFLAGCSLQPISGSNKSSIQSSYDTQSSSVLSSFKSSEEPSIQSQEASISLSSDFSSPDLSTISSVVSSSPSSIQSSALFSSQISSLSSFSKKDYGTDWYDGYYDSVLSWKNSEDLVKKLNNVIRKNKNNLKYTTPNWETNQYADQALDDFESVDVVYSDKNILKNLTQTGWSREHAFCASLMTSQTTSNATNYLGRATDFHNLFASDASGNSSRSDKNFGVADKNDIHYENRKAYSFDEKNFEPSNDDKGRLARSVLYVDLMYNKSSEEEFKANGTSSITYGPAALREEYASMDTIPEHTHYMGNKTTIVKWATTFEVDRLEYQHNESVFSHVHSNYDISQNNRNPFVDYPELVEYCYGSKKDEPGELKYLEPSYYTLNISSKEHCNFALKSAPRTFLKGDKFNYSDIKLVDVKNNFSFTDCTISFSCNIADQTILNTVGEKTISLSINGQVITYEIVVQDSKVDGAAYRYNFGGNKSSFHPSLGAEKVTLNEVEWKIDYGNPNIAISAVSTPASVKFGTSKVALSTLTFESANDFLVDEKDKIQGIYVKANTASGCSYSMRFYINGSVVGTTTITYTAKGTDPNYVTYGVTLSNPKTGKVKIEIFNINNALYISDIAVNVIS